MDFTALVCWVLCLCSSCLRNCSRRFLNIWFTMRDHCTNPSGLSISHSRPYCSMVSHSWPHSVWQILFILLEELFSKVLNIWFAMRGHCTNPVWFTDLSFKTLWFPDLLFKTSFSLIGGYRMKQLAATLWWSCTFSWRCCCAAFMLYGLLFNSWLMAARYSMWWMQRVVSVLSSFEDYLKLL